MRRDLVYPIPDFIRSGGRDVARLRHDVARAMERTISTKSGGRSGTTFDPRGVMGEMLVVRECALLGHDFPWVASGGYKELRDVGPFEVQTVGEGKATNLILRQADKVDGSTPYINVFIDVPGENYFIDGWITFEEGWSIGTAASWGQNARIIDPLKLRPLEEFSFDVAA